jgi:hypothetical protein
MKRERYEALRKSRADERYMLSDMDMCLDAPCAMEMGLAPGGLMRQEIYDDDYGFDSWDQSAGSRCFVHITSSPSYFAVTGSRPPHEPPTAEEYTNAGLPWFEYYGGDKKALAGAAKLAELDSVAAKAIKKGEGILPGNQPVVPANVVSLSGKQTVREGRF